MNLSTKDCLSVEQLDPLELARLTPAGEAFQSDTRTGWERTRQLLNLSKFLELTPAFLQAVSEQQSGLGAPARWGLRQTHGSFVLQVSWDWGTYTPRRSFRLAYLPRAWKHLVQYINEDEERHIRALPGNEHGLGLRAIAA